MGSYYWRVKEGVEALPFMKATYTVTVGSPSLPLPPELLEHIYLFSTNGRLKINEVRRLYPAALLFGMSGVTDREIVHGALELELPVKL